MQQRSAIRIDQVLHGYDHGHRELSASINLDEQSRATMLVQSDLLVVDLPEGASYLTAYPLRTASRHVLARTWAAGRGYRPGSVWTHSLILDYQALALIPDLVALRSLFRDPNLANSNDYSGHVGFSLAERSHVPVEQGPRAVNALMQLYGDASTHDVLVPQESYEFDEILALALWRQMWPGLRREFAFLTGAGAHPVTFDSSCVLRFSRPAFSKTEDHRDGGMPPGCLALLDDLPSSDPTALRSFLSRYVIESKRPRRLVLRLASLQSEMTGVSLEIRLRELRSLTREEPLPRLVRDVVIEVLHSLSSISDLIALVREFRNEVVDIDLNGTTEWTGSMAEYEFREIVAATQPSNDHELGGRLFAELVRSARLEVLATTADPTNRILMLRIRPELVTVRGFWPKDDQGRADLIMQICDVLALDLDQGIEIFGASMGERTAASLLHATLDNVPRSAVTLLESASPDVRDVVANWIVRAPQRLISFAGMPEIATDEVVAVLARAQIRSSVSIVDASSWATLLCYENGKVGQRFGNAGLVVGYISALRLNGEKSLMLAEAVFDPLQHAVRHYRLSRDEERYLESGLLSHKGALSLRTSLTRSAVLKWPLNAVTLGALAISSDREHLRDLICDIAMHQGRHCLEEVLARGGLSSATRESVARFLDGAGKKPRFFWW